MTDYPSIQPEYVREGDVVQLRHGAHRGFAVTEGTVWRTQHGNLLVGNSLISEARDLRLVSRPTPPEPPLRVGDWVRTYRGGEGQVRRVEHGVAFLAAHETAIPVGNCTRIEPPVGWPVQDEDGKWYSRHHVNDPRYVEFPLDGTRGDSKTWADLLAAGGRPALAVTR